MLTAAVRILLGHKLKNNHFFNEWLFKIIIVLSWQSFISITQHDDDFFIQIENIAFYPQTSFAISLTSLIFAHCSSSVSLLPISQEAKPHWGDKQSLSSGIYWVASWIRFLITSLSHFLYHYAARISFLEKLCKHKFIYTHSLYLLLTLY